MPVRLKIISGGQTGADLGGLQAAKACGIPTGGFCPRGYRSEVGYSPWLIRYGLVETESKDYIERTLKNVGMATAAVWFGNPYSAGGSLTLGACEKRGVDVFVVINESTPEEVIRWLKGVVFPGHDEVVLLVAGNRESKRPGIQVSTKEFLTKVFSLLQGGRLDFF